MTPFFSPCLVACENLLLFLFSWFSQPGGVLDSGYLWSVTGCLPTLCTRPFYLIIQSTIFFLSYSYSLCPLHLREAFTRSLLYQILTLCSSSGFRCIFTFSSFLPFLLLVFKVRVQSQLYSHIVLHII